MSFISSELLDIKICCDILENTLSENAHSKNTVSKNTVLENTVSENTISENMVSENAGLENIYMGYERIIVCNTLPLMGKPGPERQIMKIRCSCLLFFPYCETFKLFRGGETEMLLE